MLTPAPDEHYMRQALREAQAAYDDGEVPIGCRQSMHIAGGYRAAHGVDAAPGQSRRARSDKIDETIDTFEHESSGCEYRSCQVEPAPSTAGGRSRGDERLSSEEPADAAGPHNHPCPAAAERAWSR